MPAEKKLMTKEMYLEQLRQFGSVIDQAQNDILRLGYHLQPPVGWLNDPNGLCRIGDDYHIYFQYSPFNAEGGNGLWGHMTSKDLLHFQEHEPAVYPDCAWDQHGAYSGSAYEEDGTYYVFYTGNVKYTDKKYDYTTAGREQNVILITSRDGYDFTEKELLMTNDDFPEDMSKHVRDPQVIRKNGQYFMLLGARTLTDKGCVLLYESSDLRHWEYKLRFTTADTFGYMWECPNYAEVNGQGFLIACPQGLPSQGLDYANTYQCGAFKLDYRFGETDYRIGGFRELDRGFDFYAPQILQDKQERTLLIGWMGMPDSDYDNAPTLKNGWQHCLTIPRELYLTKEGQLAQRPIRELETIRGERHEEHFSGTFRQNVPLLFDMELDFEKCESFTIRIRENAVLTYDKDALLLDISRCGRGRKTRGVHLQNIRNIRILSDSSTLEIFVNDGEEVFTTRIYDSMTDLSCEMTEGNAQGSVVWYELRP